MKAECPECGLEFEVEDVLVGEIVECPDCGMELEVLSIKGGDVKLTEAETEMEDWGE